MSTGLATVGLAKTKGEVDAGVRSHLGNAISFAAPKAMKQSFR
ncbi:hypothetical protein [Moorena producens]